MARALDLAAHVDVRRREPPASLPPERLAEIQALLDEDAAARRDDPRGLRAPWSETRAKGEK
jgi:hypothetical protein